VTGHEAALSALFAVIVTGIPAGHTVMRATGTPDATPFDKASVLLHDGACIEAEPILSPLCYEIVWQADVTVDAEIPAARRAAEDAIATCLIADPTLGGAVDWAEIGMPETAVEAAVSLDGQGQQPPLYAIQVPIRLHYVAASPLG
jgi:hypothetical protein